MKVAVTGASGFVGRNLLASLRDAGIPVIALSRTVPGGGSVEARRLPGPQETDAEFLAAVAGATHVVHCAGLTNAARDTPEGAYMAANEGVTARLATASRAAGVQRFVLLSSIRAAVGATFDGIIAATTPPAPADAYGRSKLAAERAAAAAFADQPDRLTVLRLAPVYGVGMKGNLGRLLRLADTPLPLPFGSLDAARTLVAVEAVAELAVAMLLASGPLRPLYLVGDRFPASLSEIVSAFRRGLNRPRRLLPVPLSLLAAIAASVGKADTLRALTASQVCDTSALAIDGLPQRRDSLAGLRGVAQASLSGAETPS